MQVPAQHIELLHHVRKECQRGKTGPNAHAFVRLKNAKCLLLSLLDHHSSAISSCNLHVLCAMHPDHRNHCRLHRLSRSAHLATLPS